MLNNNIDPLVISGFVPLTTIDYPDHLSAVVFCQGCPFRCHYCHNPSLIPRLKQGKYSWKTIKNFLLDRIGLLEAVVFSGGEPTLQKDLLYAVKLVKDLGFKVGLHTAGPYPERLKELLKVIDWVGMDIKAPFDDYVSITSIPNSGKKALQSTELILASKVEYEFRTTVHYKLLSQAQIMKIKDTLFKMGATNHKIQQFRKEGCINQELNIPNMVS